MSGLTSTKAQHVAQALVGLARWDFSGDSNSTLHQIQVPLLDVALATANQQPCFEILSGWTGGWGLQNYWQQFLAFKPGTSNENNAQPVFVQALQRVKEMSPSVNLETDKSTLYAFFKAVLEKPEQWPHGECYWTQLVEVLYGLETPKQRANFEALERMIPENYRLDAEKAASVKELKTTKRPKVPPRQSRASAASAPAKAPKPSEFKVLLGRQKNLLDYVLKKSEGTAKARFYTIHKTIVQEEQFKNGQTCWKELLAFQKRGQKSVFIQALEMVRDAMAGRMPLATQSDSSIAQFLKHILEAPEQWPEGECYWRQLVEVFYGLDLPEQQANFKALEGMISEAYRLNAEKAAGIQALKDAKDLEKTQRDASSSEEAPPKPPRAKRRRPAVLSRAATTRLQGVPAADGVRRDEKGGLTRSMHRVITGAEVPSPVTDAATRPEMTFLPPSLPPEAGGMLSPLGRSDMLPPGIALEDSDDDLDSPAASQVLVEPKDSPLSESTWSTHASFCASPDNLAGGVVAASMMEKVQGAFWERPQTATDPVTVREPVRDPALGGVDVAGRAATLLKNFPSLRGGAPVSKLKPSAPAPAMPAAEGAAATAAPAPVQAFEYTFLPGTEIPDPKQFDAWKTWQASKSSQAVETSSVPQQFDTASAAAATAGTVKQEQPQGSVAPELAAVLLQRRKAVGLSDSVMASPVQNAAQGENSANADDPAAPQSPVPPKGSSTLPGGPPGRLPGVGTPTRASSVSSAAAAAKAAAPPPVHGRQADGVALPKIFTDAVSQGSVRDMMKHLVGLDEISEGQLDAYVQKLNTVPAFWSCLQDVQALLACTAHKDDLTQPDTLWGKACALGELKDPSDDNNKSELLKKWHACMRAYYQSAPDIQKTFAAQLSYLTPKERKVMFWMAIAGIATAGLVSAATVLVGFMMALIRRARGQHVRTLDGKNQLQKKGLWESAGSQFSCGHAALFQSSVKDGKGAPGSPPPAPPPPAPPPPPR